MTAPTVMENVRSKLNNGLRCICHVNVLYGAIGKALALPAAKEPLDKLRRLCQHVKQSCVLTEQLYREQKKIGLPEQKMILDAKWRWGYSLAMINRFLDNEATVAKLNLGDAWAVFEEDIACLKNIARVLGEIVSNTTSTQQLQWLLQV